MSSFADRPPPDPERFLVALAEWRAGDNTAGTTMQTLKRGGLDELLAENVETGSELLVVWNEWERGGAAPGPILERLDAGGLSGLLERVQAAQREVFGTP